MIMIRDFLFLPKEERKHRWVVYFLFLLLFELFLGGSGQDIHITGFLTLRMVNYIVAVGLGLMYFVGGGKMAKDFITLVVLFTLLLAFAYAIAVINNSSSENVIEDIKPLSYFYILFFFSYIFRSKFVIQKAYDVLLLSGKLMVVLYIVYILITDILGIFDFSWAYATFISDNFLFRGVGSAFYYKGFVFIPIAAIGFLKDKNYLWFILSVVAVYFTYTRGLYVLLVVGCLFYILRAKGVKLSVLIGILFLSYTLYQGAKYFEIFDIGEDYTEKREGGDELRFETINQVKSEINVVSFFVGHGFGHGVKNRPVHMEMSYLEIFHKQGVIGLVFWGTVLLLILSYNKKVPKGNKGISDFYMISSIMIFIQSFFNPYINNPIGMGMVLVSLVCCYYFAHEITRHNSTIQLQSV